MLQLDEALRCEAGKSRVRFPIVSLDFFVDIFHTSRTIAPESTQPLTQINTMTISREKRRLLFRADKLTTFMCKLS